MKKLKGFTLIELLVVISIIALLVAILMPALSKAKSQARVVVCASQLHQWGIGFGMYGSDNDDALPDNSGGTGPCGPGQVVREFWDDYLMKLDSSGDSNLMYCPTNQQHQRYTEQHGNDFDVFWLGYIYISGSNNGNGGHYQGMYTYEDDTKNWLMRKKLGSKYRTAPLFMDLLKWSLNRGWGNDYGNFSNHVRSGKRSPIGSNQLFEDGSTLWYNINELELGIKNPWWEFYNKPSQFGVSSLASTNNDW